MAEPTQQRPQFVLVAGGRILSPADDPDWPEHTPVRSYSLAEAETARAQLRAQGHWTQIAELTPVPASAEERARVLAEHILTPGGWECDGCLRSSFNDCPALHAVLSASELAELLRAPEHTHAQIRARLSNRSH